MKGWKRTVKELTDLDPPGHNKEDQFYGMEVELENVRGISRQAELLYGWRTVGDGSLRNNGVEFITSPVQLAQLFSLVDHLYEAKAGGGWTGGPRCGIHIHMDMSHRSVGELHAMMVAYACVEPIVFDFCGSDREENIFCVPWYRAPDDIRELQSFFYGNTTRRVLQRACGHASKYTSMFHGPLTRFNTLEFRGAPVFESKEQTKELCSMLDLLVSSTLGSTGEQVMEGFVDDPVTALELYFPWANTGKSLALMEERDSIGTALNLVRTKMEPGQWAMGQDPNAWAADRPEEQVIEDHRAILNREIERMRAEARGQNVGVRIGRPRRQR